MKIGLVLEGGAMRGMFTAGVLDVMMGNNIAVDTVVGVSAGALFGVNFLSRQIGRVIRPSKPIEIGRIEKDPGKLQAVYDLGVSDGTEKLAALKAFLE